MPYTTKNAYAKRFQLVFDYIEQHLDHNLSLEQLSAVAHFSAFHFHRQFTAYCGMPLARYIQVQRLKRASYRLAFNPHDKVIDIAFDAGFQHAESFSRAFRQTFGITPSQFRQQPDWSRWHQSLPTSTIEREHQMQVKIVDFPSTKVAVLTHQGTVELLNETAANFIAWRKTSGCSPVASSHTYGLAPNDPTTTMPEAFRFTFAGSITAPIAEDNPFGVTNSEIPAGRCAVVRHLGSHEHLTQCARALYSDWLPESGEELRDFPLLFHYHNFIHDVPAHELVTDIYLPLK